MTDHAGDAVLAAECVTFTRYLIARPPDMATLKAYCRAHEVSDVASSLAPLALDAAVLRLAWLGPRWARLADAFASALVRGGLLRRKLVLLVAILESRGDTAPLLDLARPGSRLVWIGEAAVRAAASVMFLCAAAVFVVPLTAWYLAMPTAAPSGRRSSAR